MDCTVHGVTKELDTTERLSLFLISLVLGVVMASWWDHIFLSSPFISLFFLFDSPIGKSDS